MELLRLEEEREQFLHPRAGQKRDDKQSCVGKPSPAQTEKA
jgi:hypothetical protein